MSTNPRFSLLISIFIFILINSCDDNAIAFDSGDSGINYYEQSFVLNLEKSLFESNPIHYADDSLFNQSLAPKLYLGNIGLFEEENLSYALFQFNPDIINNYSICDSSLISIDDVTFTLKFDNPIYEDGQYMPDNDFYGTGGHQSSNNNASYNFNNIEEDTDLYQTPFYINSYFWPDASQIFTSDTSLENTSNIHDDSYIQALINEIKQHNLILPNLRNSN